MVVDRTSWIDSSLWRGNRDLLIGSVFAHSYEREYSRLERYPDVLHRKLIIQASAERIRKMQTNNI